MADTHAPREEEPKTPMWLPALGAALFLLGGMWWAWSSSPSATPADPAHPAAGKPAAAAHP
ncbi:MAG: hypothetical protein IPQ09_16430 [Myxococcales bacterium]|jgi:hypothetical protein|nr:hypothetical protein [Myxococcales bacterium]HQY63323.1 hypothetical protein [Polyangiaceae bacterium]